jgi:hypothetical protein
MTMANSVIAGGFYLPEGTAFILGISDVTMGGYSAVAVNAKQAVDLFDLPA